MSNNFETGGTAAHTCPRCGMWIVDNLLHYCTDEVQPTTTPNYMPNFSWQFIDPSVLERIAKALETIAGKLSRS